MYNFYDLLALYRNHCANGNQELIAICEALYDVAAANKKKPGELPKNFSLANIKTDAGTIKMVLDDLRIRAKDVKMTRSTLRGNTFEVNLK